MAQDNEIRDGELSAQEAPGGGYEVFSDDDPFGMPAGYAEPGQDPHEAMAEMHRNAAEYEAEQAAGSGGGSGRVARKTLPIPRSRGASSQAGLASIKRGLDYSGAPAPGEPGSRSNPVVVTHEERARRTVVISPDGQVVPRSPGSSPQAEQAESAGLIDSAAVQAVMGVAAPTMEVDSVGKAAVSGFVNGATGQLQSQAATKSQRSAAEARRQKMSAWADQIEANGDDGKGLERD